MDNKTKRIGKFSIQKWLIDECVNGLPTNELYEIFSKVIVIDAKYDYMSDSIEYTAYSELFDPIPMGQVAPVYSVLICVTYSTGSRTTHFEKFERLM